MTEYEAASLALERAQAVREQVALVQTQASLYSESVLTFFTILSGYLVVAHFVAARLTRLQAAILNSLYVVMSGFAAAGIYTAQSAGALHAARLIELSPDETMPPIWTGAAVFGSVSLVVVSVVASMTFFYSARRRIESLDDIDADIDEGGASDSAN